VSELRWNPLLREWVSVAAARQNRPQMPRDWCPFCPGSGKVPEHYETLLYPNDFAAFSPDNLPFEDQPGIFATTGSRGSCDVVLYHPDHNLKPSAMSAGHWSRVVELWRARTEQLFDDPEIAYVYIFENTGEAIGVTMPHPHGQIYALPMVPPLVQREFDSALSYMEEQSECLYCRLLAEELRAGKRIVLETDRFVAFVPFHAKWPGEMQIYPKRHAQSLMDLNDEERAELARMIKTVRMKYDNLWGFAIPLIMTVRQPPVSGEHLYFHFHVEFLPIQRSPTKIKYLAGIESGTGLFLNDTVAEEKAAELREAAPRNQGAE
jgi:UDPglucose--hexose-1-phosphate uridylyltransferase